MSTLTSEGGTGTWRGHWLSFPNHCSSKLRLLLLIDATALHLRLKHWTSLRNTKFCRFVELPWMTFEWMEQKFKANRMHITWWHGNDCSHGSLWASRKYFTYNFQVKFVNLRGSLLEVDTTSVGSLVGRLQVLYGEVRRLVLSSEECSAPEVSIIVPMFSEGLNVLPHIVTEMKIANIIWNKWKRAWTELLVTRHHRNWMEICTFKICLNMFAKSCDNF